MAIYKILDCDGTWVAERDSKEHAEITRDHLDEEDPSSAPHRIEKVD